MGCLRPATPGFICTLTATVLLAIVSFCVPYFKSIFFLKATITQGNTTGFITFGTLGYCIELPSGTTCSSPSVGYSLDINALVGNKLPIQIPNAVVKWLTYALVLHIVALVLSAGSAVFGLLAHVREMAMTCCSTCISGLAATVALLAFIFDLVLFFVAKSRINAVGSASMGNAIWLTLGAWVLLFFSGCFYTIGRCCISNRAPRADHGKRIGSEPYSGGGYSGGGHATYAEQMRMDAVKAEVDRKARQKETGLPAFYETQPLTARIDGDQVYVDHGDNHPSPAPTPAPMASTRPQHQANRPIPGYVQGPPGSRAIDEYYHPSRDNNASYPPPQQRPPQRQPSGYSNYPASSHPSAYNSSTNSNQYLAAGAQYPDRLQNATPGREYGHTQGGTSYHSAISHQQQPTNYSQYDQPAQYAQQPQHTYHDPYNNPTSPPLPSPNYGGNSNTNSFYSTNSANPALGQPERQYTLGGDGYGANTVPPLAEHQYQTDNHYYGYADNKNLPSPHVLPNTQPTNAGPSSFEEPPPPGYDAGNAGVTGRWGKQ